MPASEMFFLGFDFVLAGVIVWGVWLTERDMRADREYQERQLRDL